MKGNLINLKSEEIEGLGLGDLYDYIAKEKLCLDKKTVDSAKFDCRKITYAAGVDEILRGNYKKMGVSDESITIRFIWFAPKINHSLKGNEVLVEDGFLIFN